MRVPGSLRSNLSEKPAGQPREEGRGFAPAGQPLSLSEAGGDGEEEEGEGAAEQLLLLLRSRGRGRGRERSAAATTSDSLPCCSGHGALANLAPANPPAPHRFMWAAEAVEQRNKRRGGFFRREIKGELDDADLRLISSSLFSILRFEGACGKKLSLFFLSSGSTCSALCCSRVASPLSSSSSFNVLTKPLTHERSLAASVCRLGSGSNSSGFAFSSKRAAMPSPPPVHPVPFLPSIAAPRGSLCFSEKRSSCCFCHSDGTRRNWRGRSGQGRAGHDTNVVSVVNVVVVRRRRLRP